MGDMFHVLESEGGQTGSRAMRPPRGASSDLFGSPEEGVPSSRPNRMASNIFGPTEEPQNIPKRTNPPGTGLGDSFVLWPLPVFELLFCVYTHTHTEILSHIFWYRLSLAIRVLECEEHFCLKVARSFLNSPSLSADIGQAWALRVQTPTRETFPAVPWAP